ncbi:hypothetical protein GCM10011396_53690 [Undibacterium terreum]|uniref:Uncharacterized protein n=1 Tax=Undibacterium terreum TaxID=1224302 RepID=A0A916V251_9BURK|nr:hypothetical protein GCM10011396_53690 [Undibacterium terreum]
MGCNCELLEQGKMTAVLMGIYVNSASIEMRSEITYVFMRNALRLLIQAHNKVIANVSAG